MLHVINILEKVSQLQKESNSYSIFLFDKKPRERLLPGFVFGVHKKVNSNTVTYKVYSIEIETVEMTK